VRDGVDIAAWLRELGLERYEQAFRESDVDTDILADLTETDLEELGISLSHRKKLLKAIAGLGLIKFQAERRQLTVLFCDLVGSTELLEELDPEDMGGVINAYQQCCRSVIGRWDGHVAKYRGDSMLVYFGWPRALTTMPSERSTPA
jgi:class 3 adenylate cyclase